MCLEKRPQILTELEPIVKCDNIAMKKKIMKALLETHNTKSAIQMGRSLDHFLKLYLTSNTNYKQKKIELNNTFSSITNKVRKTIWNEYNFYIITIEDFHLLIRKNVIIDSYHAEETKLFLDDILRHEYGSKSIDNMIYYYTTNEHPKKEISINENVKTEEDNNVEPVVIF